MADKPSVQEQKMVKPFFALLGLGGVAAIVFLLSKVVGGIVNGDFNAIGLNLFFTPITVMITWFCLYLGFVKKIEYPEEDDSA